MTTPPHDDPALGRILDQVQAAYADGHKLHIRGGGTKSFIAAKPAAVGQMLDIRPLRGISSYEPSELVVTVRAGTPLEELNAVLAERGQYLPFDPPQFAPGTTVGGMVAAGLSGPSRAAVGSVRDYVLGVTMMDGRGQVLTFGGQVMKNVAGYDISRVLAGSWGALGVILEVSLKVLPFPAFTQTLVIDADRHETLAALDSWRCQPLPVNATAWHAGVLSVRLAGARAAVEAASRMMGDRHGARVLDDPTHIGGHRTADADLDWNSVRDQYHPFFVNANIATNATGINMAETARSLWRISLPAGISPLDLMESSLAEWGGQLRWVATSVPARTVHEMVERVGGSAMRWRGACCDEASCVPMDKVTLALHRRLKQAFDPAGIFNVGQLHPSL